MNNQTSRAIILDGTKMLLIHRIKAEGEKYVIPGGHIEDGETPEETVLREIKEETNLDIVIKKKLWTLTHPDDGSLHHFYLVEDFQGEIKLGGPEVERQSEANQYIFEWHELSNLVNLNIQPVKLKETLVKELVL